jgi:hypothetical protein
MNTETTVVTLPDVEQLARTYSALIIDLLSPREIFELIRRNSAEADPDVCHASDFCAAEALLDEAWIKLVGEKFEVSAWSLGPKMSNMEAYARRSAASRMARHNKFWWFKRA